MGYRTNNMCTLQCYFLNVALQICFIFVINSGRRVYVGSTPTGGQSVIIIIGSNSNIDLQLSFYVHLQFICNKLYFIPL